MNDDCTEIWTGVLNKYIRKLISPDGRQTYESKSELVHLMIESARLKKTDTVVDIGCGWGNFPNACRGFSDKVIGIEPNADNLKEAMNRSRGKGIEYIQGSFENLNYNGKADKIISMLAFHQVPWNDKAKALKNVSESLAWDGCFLLCDTVILFNPDENPELFDKVYRYLLRETVPDEIYKKHIEPYLVDGEVYTLNDMREGSPKDNWFYSMKDLDEWAEFAGLESEKKVELCPFFGVIAFRKR